MTKLGESQVESAALAWLADLGYATAHGPHLSPEGATPERASYADVVLADRLRVRLACITPGIPSAAVGEVAKKGLRAGLRTPIERIAIPGGNVGSRAGKLIQSIGEARTSGLIRHHGGHDLPPLEAVDAEIAVERHHGAARVLFCHAHQAGVRQRHGHGRVSVHQGADGTGFRIQTKRYLQHAAFEQLQHSPGRAGQAPQQEAGLGEHRLAGHQRRHQVREARLGPVVMAVAAVQQRDEWAGVENDAPVGGHRVVPALGPVAVQMPVRMGEILGPLEGTHQVTGEVQRGAGRRLIALCQVQVQCTANDLGLACALPGREGREAGIQFVGELEGERFHA